MADYDPVRWVCQCRPEDCKGTFFVYGQGRPCPLWARCSGSKPQLEYLYYQRSPHQVRLHITDPAHRYQHQKRWKDLVRAFKPEEVAEAARRHRANSRDRNQAIQGRKYREEHAPGASAPRYDIPPPPCGGDHENCIYGGDCRYPTWEDDWLDKHALELRGAENARRQARHKARMATEPEYAETFRAKSNARQRARRKDPAVKAKYAKKWREKVDTETPEEHRARLDRHNELCKAREAAETPEQREARLAQRRAAAARRRAAETPEQREARLAKNREAYRAKADAMTPEQREVENAKQRERYWAAHDSRLAWKRENRKEKKKE